MTRINTKPGIVARARRAKAAKRARAYKKNCAIVDARDEQICTCCRQYWGASIHHHHRKPRSLGRDDSPENLVSVCPVCHAAIHAKRMSL